MFYQTHSFPTIDGVKLENGIDFSFPMHLHSNFELIVVTEGEMQVAVDNKIYTLKQEEALLVFPNQAHELKTIEHSCHFLCIFSSKLVSAFSTLYSSMVPENNLFKPDFAYIEKLASLTSSDSIMSVKGILYSICGMFDETACYVKDSRRNNELLSEIFNFVENNYSSKCSLEDLSESTTYNYVYLSKYFKRMTGISFTDYVNRFRISEACYLLLNSSDSILSIAYDCGFDSLRSFNRNFKNIIGKTPSEYKSRI